MNTLFIHAGLHKTGTSAIQDFCDLNRSFLAEHNIIYPPTYPFQAHHAFASRLKGKDAKEIKELVDQYVVLHLSELSADSNVLISSEMLSEGTDPCFLTFFAPYFQKVKIIFYLRRQDELLESAYNQQVKQNGETRSISDYTPYMVELDKHLDWYKQTLRESDEVVVRLYEGSRMTHGNSVHDFIIHCLGIDEDRLSPQSLASMPINPSLSVPACLVMARINSLNLSALARSRVIDFLLESFSDRSFKSLKLLADDDEKKLLMQLRESNLRLDSAYLGEAYFSSLVPRNLSYCSPSEAYLLARENAVLEEICTITGVAICWDSLFS